jgi:hypothetical protein
MGSCSKKPFSARIITEQYMGFKKYRILAVIIMMVLLSGCAQMISSRHEKIFTDIHKAYKNAILWSDFEYASSFHKTDSQDQARLDPMYYKIKVTAYDEKRHVINSDATKIEQTVQIQYYWTDQMLEKIIIINPVWEWDTQSKYWYLSTGLPHFN